MGALVFSFFNVSAGGFGKLDTTSAPVAANTGTVINWQSLGATGNGNSETQISYNATVSGTDGVFVAPGTPTAPKLLRSLNPLQGTFAAGAWTLNLEQEGSGTAPVDPGTDATIVVGYDFRIFKGSNSDGSNAVEITTGGPFSTGVEQYQPSPSILSGTTPPLAAVTFSNEFWFVTISLVVSTGLTQDFSGTNTLRVGGTNVTTPNFTSGATHLLTSLGVGQ